MYHNFYLEILALLDVRHCPKLQSCAVSRKTNDATWHGKKMKYLLENLKWDNVMNLQCKYINQCISKERKQLNCSKKS